MYIKLLYLFSFYYLVPAFYYWFRRFMFQCVIICITWLFVDICKNFLFRVFILLIHRFYHLSYHVICFFHYWFTITCIVLFIVCLLCLFYAYFTSFDCVFLLLICVRWFVWFPRFIFRGDGSWSQGTDVGVSSMWCGVSREVYRGDFRASENIIVWCSEYFCESDRSNSGTTAPTIPRLVCDYERN